MPALRPIVWTACLLGTIAAPAFAGAIRPETDPASGEPATAKTSFRQGFRFHFRPVGIAPPSRPAAEVDPKPATSPAAPVVDPAQPRKEDATKEAEPAVAKAPEVLPAAPARPAMAEKTPASAVADAYLDFKDGPYAQSSQLTTGDAKPWYTSPVVTRLFGGNSPDASQQAAFESKVVATVADTYDRAGIPVRLTTDPAVSAAHTLSVVANAQSPDNPGAIGITNVGYDGFSFIDKFTPARTSNELAIAVGHNVAHELMHAFGIADHPEATGNYVDAAVTPWTTLTDPNASFSRPAATLLSTLDLHATGDLVNVASTDGRQVWLDGAQAIAPAPAPVPEPSTVALWLLAGALTFVLRRRA